MFDLQKAEEKAYKIKKNFRISRDTARKIVSIVLVVATLIINGFLSFMPYSGMDFSRLGTSAYWLNYVLLTGSEMVIMVAIYIIRKSRNLATDEIVGLCKDINVYRDRIYRLNKVKVSAEWLRNFYNPREKLNLFEDKIRNIQTGLMIDEPLEVEPEDKKRYKAYLKELARYKRDIQKYEWCEKQLKLVKRDREKFELIRQIVTEKAKLDESKVDEKKIEQLEKQVEAIDKELFENNFAIQRYKLKFEKVYWDTLVAEGQYNSKHRQSAYFHEKRLIAKRLQTFLMASLIISTIFLSMLPPILEPFTWQTVLDLFFKLVMFAWCGLQGLLLADNNILFDYKAVLGVRKSIYNELNYDLGVEKIVIEDEKKEQN